MTFFELLKYLQVNLLNYCLLQENETDNSQNKDTSKKPVANSSTTTNNVSSKSTPKQGTFQHSREFIRSRDYNKNPTHKRDESSGSVSSNRSGSQNRNRPVSCGASYEYYGQGKGGSHHNGHHTYNKNYRGHQNNGQQGSKVFSKRRKSATYTTQNSNFKKDSVSMNVNSGR